MPAQTSDTLIHYRSGWDAPPACGESMAAPGTAVFGAVTCFACRRTHQFLRDQKGAELGGVEPPTPPVKLSEVINHSPDLAEIAERAAASQKLQAQRNERGMFVIEETIHHGDYRSTRRVEVYDINPVTVDAIIQSSAYCYGSWLDPHGPYPGARRPKLFELVADLRAGRENRQIGWSTFRLIK